MSEENNNHTLPNRDMTSDPETLDVTASGRQEGDGLNWDVNGEEYEEEYLDISEFLMIQIDEEDSSLPDTNSRLGSRRKAPVAATASRSGTLLKRIHLSNNRDGSPRTPIQPFRQPPLTKSALLQQLQTPVNSKPNILKKSSQPYTMPPPPRFLQPRPNINFPSPMPSSSQKEISLERHVTSSCNPLQQTTNNPIFNNSSFEFMAGQTSMFGKMSQPQQGPYYGIQQQTYPMTEILPMHNILSSLQMVVLPTGYRQEFRPSVFGGSLYQQQNLNFSPSIVPTHWCTVCCQTFWSMESLQAHSLTHQAEFNSRFPFPSASGHGLPSGNNLEQQEATHKKHKCRWCKKAFGFTTNLRAHERVHTGERPYKCADCPKDYKQLGGLHYHLKANPGHRAQKYKLEDQGWKK